MAILSSDVPFNTISLGNLLTIIVFVVGLVGSHIRNMREFSSMQFKLDLMWEWWQKDMIKSTVHKTRRFVVPEEED